jgi:peptidoglycan/LPS O-acetylase OafA/YrhL
VAVVVFPLALLVGANLLREPMLAALCVFVVFPLILRCAVGMGESRLAQAAGALSFPLYAVHLPVIATVMVLGLPPWVAAIAALAVALGVTWIFELRRKVSASRLAQQPA